MLKCLLIVAFYEMVEVHIFLYHVQGSVALLKEWLYLLYLCFLHAMIYVLIVSYKSSSELMFTVVMHNMYRL